MNHLPSTSFERMILDNYKQCLNIWMDEQDEEFETAEEEETVDIDQILHELTEIWERERLTIAGVILTYEDIVEIIDRNPHYLKFIDHMIIEEMNKEHELVDEIECLEDSDQINEDWIDEETN
jgi:hypothetical protein